MLEPKSNEKITNKIIEINDCKNNNETKHLIHDLKSQELESNKRDNIAKGEIKTKTLIITKRKE